MAAGAGSLGVGLLAGTLSTLSPCVLPILPLVFSAAVAAHRWGAVALAAGVALSFTLVGVFVATLGFALGLDGDVFRAGSAVLLAAFGVVLLSGALQARFAGAAAGVGAAGQRVLAWLPGGSLLGQFVVGAVLGAAWSPCVGPTLGAASLLAAQGRSLGAVVGVMLAFGIGAALPLALVGVLSRQALRRWRGRMAWAAHGGKLALGAGALLVAALILTGADRALETAAVVASPAWLTDLTTRF